MVAPAGVSEGTPPEPAGAALAHAEVAEAPTAASPGPAETGPAETILPAAEAAGGEPTVAPAKAALAEAVPAQAAPAEDSPEEAAPTGEEHEAAVTGQAKAGPGEEEAAAPDDAGGPDPGYEEVSRAVSPLAVAGIILGIIALAGVAVGALAVLTHGFRPKTVITYRPAAVFGLLPGECINSGANALDVSVLSCATAHDAEVFATFGLPKTGWPGTAAVQQDAGNGCASRLSGYLNPQLAAADLTQELFYPDKAAWQAGVRTVVCVVRAVSGQLTGSVRAPG